MATAPELLLTEIQTMQITRKSMFTGVVRTIEIAITQQQLDAWKIDKVDIQIVAPELQPWEREFIMTGVTKEEWAEWSARMDEIEEGL